MKALIKADELRCYSCGEETTVIVTMDGDRKLRRCCDEQCFALWNRHCATAFEERRAA
jgi:hypothetical protein